MIFEEFKEIRDINEETLIELFSETVGCLELECLSFVEDFVNDMAAMADEYEHVFNFFQELSENGCSSGMVSMLFHDKTCCEIYAEHYEDMENFKESLQEMQGLPILNYEKLPHAVFMCWLCYEGLAFAIARELFPENFF